MKDYVRAARSYPWLFEAVEQAVATISHGTSDDGQRMLRSIRTSDGRPIADTEALVALNALTEPILTYPCYRKYTQSASPTLPTVVPPAICRPLIVE